MNGFHGRAVAVVGAGGRQGQAALARLAAASDRPARLLAIDRGFDGAAGDAARRSGATAYEVDIGAGSESLARTLAGTDLVINLAGPYYRLGSAVLESAIAVHADYVDIADDAAAAVALLARDGQARRAGVRALTGAGAAPGVTNVLGRLAVDALGGRDVALRIAWATPVHELSASLCAHIAESLRQPRPGTARVQSWQELQPCVVEFAPPVGALETVLFGHPEPVTFARLLGIATELRGAMIPDRLMRDAFALSVASSGSAAEHEAAAVAAMRAAVQGAPAGEHTGALHIEAWCGEVGVRIQTVSAESMEDATIEPCLRFARLVLERAIEPGVAAPELLAPARFFAASGERGRAQAWAWRLRRGREATRVSLRELLATPNAEAES